jgi:hypothetical protein
MLQLTYTKGQWTGTVPDAPEDWLATIATLPAGMQYLIDYGAIIAGTVRVGSGKPKLPPIEREIIRLAGEAVDAAAEAKRAKLKKEVRAAYVEKYVERFREDLTAKATENLAKRAELQEASGSILDELFAEPEPEPVEPRRKR